MSNLPPDPWKVLGLEKAADKSEIRSAYKKLVLKCHPDKVQDPALKAQKQDEFQKVQQAYELLNDDAERTKYEEQVKLFELRKQAAMMSKNMPNSSASRTPPRQQHFTYEVRTAEHPRERRPAPPPGGGAAKMYTQYSSTHTRSHEEMPSRQYHAVFEEEERRARRSASAEYTPKPTKRDEDRRDKEERRRKREKEQQRVLEELEREQRDKEARRQERKQREKLVERERKKEAEEKSRRHKPYVEDYDLDDQKVFSIRTKEKKSSSKKHEEVRERSSSRRERAESPRVEAPAPPTSAPYKETKFMEYAANYIERSGGRAPTIHRAQTFQDVSSYSSYPSPPVAPTPPPADDDDVRRSSARRRGSHDTPKSKDKSSSHKKSSREFEVIDVTPTQKSIPSFPKTTSAPPVVPESPPRVNRANTAQEPYSRSIPMAPLFNRTHTWGAPGEDVERPRRPSYGAYDYDSDEDRHRHHRSRKHESTRYKVEGNKASKLETQYMYNDPPSRKYMPDGLESRSPHDYSSSGFKVREAKTFSYGDVKYSDIPHSYDHHDAYANAAYA